MAPFVRGCNQRGSVTAAADCGAITRFWTLVQVLLRSPAVRKVKESIDAVAPRQGTRAARSAKVPAGSGTSRRSEGSATRRRENPAPRKPRPASANAAKPQKPTRRKRPAKSPPAAPPPAAEEALQRAIAARTPRARGIWARRGLSLDKKLDRTIQAMLLRQLYLSYYEDRRFEKAAGVAEQIVELEVLPDVAHQDAARARQALGDVEAAAGHLRLAARTGPPKRRAFHWWTLGSLYFLAGRHEDAKGALSRAARWGTTDKPLYQGHLAIVRLASGEAVDDLPDLISRLSDVPAGQGYGRFVLGHLAFHAQRAEEAQKHLESFVERTEGGRLAKAIALAGEVALARQTLALISRRTAS